MVFYQDRYKDIFLQREPSRTAHERHDSLESSHLLIQDTSFFSEVVLPVFIQNIINMRRRIMGDDAAMIRKTVLMTLTHPTRLLSARVLSMVV